MSFKRIVHFSRLRGQMPALAIDRSPSDWHCVQVQAVLAAIDRSLPRESGALFCR
jgi:hypothetical protein